MDAQALRDLITEHKGSVVAVNIFASWCPPCREEVPELIQVRNSFSPSDLVLVGISVDREPMALLTFLNSLRVNYPVALALDDLAPTLGVRAVPHLLLYNTSGELVLNHRGRMDGEELTDTVRRLLSR
ncbi:MAG: TlpA family protein disulfide reductase [Desulfovibrio sp.]|nr:TlpA family protein disulfide reductase [Desulfovibrio sp.]